MRGPAQPVEQQTEKKKKQNKQGSLIRVKRMVLQKNHSNINI